MQNYYFVFKGSTLFSHLRGVCVFCNDGNNLCIPPTLDGWVYIEPIHEPLDGPLYTWAQYTPTLLVSHVGNS